MFNKWQMWVFILAAVVVQQWIQRTTPTDIVRDIKVNEVVSTQAIMAVTAYPVIPYPDLDVQEPYIYWQVETQRAVRTRYVVRRTPPKLIVDEPKPVLEADAPLALVEPTTPPYPGLAVVDPSGGTSLGRLLGYAEPSPPAYPPLVLPRKPIPRPQKPTLQGSFVDLRMGNRSYVTKWVNEYGPDRDLIYVPPGGVADGDRPQPVMMAALNTNVDALRVILSHNIPVDNPSSGLKRSALHYAAMGNVNPSAVEYLIQRGAQINLLDARRQTPLHYAAMSNTNVRVARTLLNVGANPYVSDLQGFTPLMRAAQFNPNAQVFQLLMEKGAQVDRVNTFGQNAIMLAARYNPNIQVIRALLATEQGLQATDEEGGTLLSYAQARSRQDPIRDDVINAVMQATR